MEGNKERGSPITPGIISRLYREGSSAHLPQKKESKTERGSKESLILKTPSAVTSGSSSKTIPSHPRLSGSANSVNISGHPLSLSLTILAGATWRIRALSDAIIVSRSICSISAKNVLNLHIFEAASCHIASGHGGRPDCSPCSILSASLQCARGLSMCQVSEDGTKTLCLGN